MNDLQPRRLEHEPIAIVGMGFRGPAGINSPAALTEALRAGLDAITSVPSDRWALTSQDIDLPAFGGFIEGADRFDAGFFRISPRDARALDPQQRLLLEVCWEAFENAGQDPHELSGSETGVFVGISGDDYRTLQTRSATSRHLYDRVGTTSATASGRLAYFFGFRGPAVSIDTASSSSLVALHLAVQSLLAGDTDLAIAAGVNLILAPDQHVAFGRAGMLAPDGCCKPFDARADGFVRGEGCGVVVLKRLADAQRDGNRVLACVLGSAINQDGASEGLMAPVGAAQVQVIRRALARAMVEPRDIDLVEAHGTGTPVGDQTEARALMTVFGDDERPHPLVVGSLKANIGHLGAAAGIAGVIKTVSLLRARFIPRHLHFERLNPALAPFDALIATEAMKWPARSDAPRRAAVSSFGFSGTNASVVLAEQPPTPAPAERVQRSARLLAISAREAVDLRRLARRYAEHLRRLEPAELADVCHSANLGRAHFGARLGVVVSTATEAAQALERFAAEAQGEPQPSPRHSARPRVAFIFAGHGTHRPGMVRELYQTHPVVRDACDRCARILDPLLGVSLLPAIFDAPPEDWPLDRDAIGQPASFVVQYALARLWMALGVRPDLIMGHSFGEYAAACIAGVIELEDALRLVAVRGRLVQSLPPGGAMYAVRLSAAAAHAVIGDRQDVCVGVINGPHSVVLSGSVDGIERVLASLPDDVSATRLNVSFASHSPQVEPLLSDLAQAAAAVRLSTPEVPLIPTSGLVRAGRDVTRAEYWGQHLRAPVDFAGGMAEAERHDVDIFIEISPRPVLLGAGQDCVSDPDRAAWLPSLRPDRPDWEQLASSLASVYERGGRIDWAALAANDPHITHPLPTYPFGGERYWIDPPALAQPPEAGGDRPALRFDFDLGQRSPSYLGARRVAEEHRVPAAVYLELVLTCARDLYGPGPLALQGVRIPSTLLLPVELDHTTPVSILLHRLDDARYTFRIEGPSDPWGASTDALQAYGQVLRWSGVAPEASIDRERCTESMEPEAFYAALNQRGLAYDARPEAEPDFRVVEALWRGPDGQAVGRLQLADSLRAEARAFAIHPLLLDGMIQVAWAALLDDGGAWSPASVGAVIVAPRNEPALAATAAAHVVRRTDAIAVVRVSVTDAEGTLVSVDRLEFTRSDRAAAPIPADPGLRAGAPTDWRQRVTDAAPADRGAVVEAYVRARLGRALGTTKPVDAQLTLRDLGADSLVGAELSRRFEIDLGVTLPTARITGQDRTVADLITLVTERLERAELRPSSGARTSAASASGPAPAQPDAADVAKPTSDANDFAAVASRVPQIHATVTAQERRKLQIDERWVVDFASCNYLGLDLHPEVMAAIPPAIARWGVHPSWTRAVASPGIYDELEQALAELVGAPAVLVFPSITLLHAGLLPVLAGYDGVIIKDVAAHRSVHEGCLLAQSNGARFVEFKHNDPTDLEARLAECPPHVPKIIAIDGVYSMSGAYPPLPAFSRLAQRYDAWVYIDDAHGMGIIGESPTPSMPYGQRGNGIVRHYGLDYARDRMIYVSGLSKSYSSFGAFVTCIDEQTRAHYKSASTFIFSGPSPVASLASALAGLKLNRVEGEAWRAQILRLTRRLVSEAKGIGFEVVNDNDFPIVGVVIGETQDVVDACHTLWEHGLLITPALFPIVPVGRGLLRFSITAANTEEEIDQAIRALEDVRRRVTERHSAPPSPTGLEEVSS